MCSGRKVLKKNKITKILSSTTANEFRLSTQVVHSEIRFGQQGCRKGQKNCDLCCRICSTSDGQLLANIQPHKRLGFPGFMCCKECDVVLCSKPRMKFHGIGETCFQIYHSLYGNKWLLKQLSPPHRGRDEKVAQNNRQAHKHQKERKKEQRNCSLE